MKNCKNCGSEIDEGSIYCPFCGARYDEKKKESDEKKKKNKTESEYGSDYDPRYGYMPNYGGFGGSPVIEGRSFWIALLSFVFPIVGLILWQVWRYTKPGKSASAANGALAFVSFIAPFSGAILWYFMRMSRPDISRTCGIAAIFGIVFSILLSVVSVILYEVFGLELIFYI